MSSSANRSKNTSSKRASSKQRGKHPSDENLSSTIRQEQNIAEPNDFLNNFIEINNSGYMVNFQKQLGRGRYGVVYEAYSKITRQKMAVKRIPQINQNGTNIASQTKRQIDILKQISSQKSCHKNILKYFHYQDFQDNFYVFVEYCAKGSLKEYLSKKANQISEKQYVRILKSIVEGMIFINKKFIIHRDIKPANILVTENDEIKIGDFGISREIPLRDQSLTKGQCTPIYGAPQILRDQQYYNQTCDVWSCGVMMYDMMQGKSIYQKQRPRSKNQLIKAIKYFQQKQDFLQFSNPNISQKFRKILKKMLTIQISKRPAFQQIQKSQQYEQLVKFYQLYDAPLVEQPQSQNNVVNQNIINKQQYDQKQKQKYLQILKKYLKYKRDKLSLLLSLQIKFMNKPFQVLWNVEKYILKYLTLNMYVIKAQQYSNWLHISLNDDIIDMEQELKIKISQFRYNYRKFSQILREEKKKIDSDIRKYHKLILSQAEKIQFDYLERRKQQQRIKSYMDLGVLEQMFSNTRKNSQMSFQHYHKIYKSLIQLKQYYLTYQQVQALPTFQDKEIYLHILLIYYIDKFFYQKRYIREMLMEEEIIKKFNNQESGGGSRNKDDLGSKMSSRIKELLVNKEKDRRSNRKGSKDEVINTGTFQKSLQTSTSGTMVESISDFKQRMEDEKQMMKWIFRHNLSRKEVFQNNKSMRRTQSIQNQEIRTQLKKGNNKTLKFLQKQSIQKSKDQKNHSNSKNSQASQNNSLKQNSKSSRKQQLQVNQYNIQQIQHIPTSDRKLNQSKNSNYAK